MPANSRSYDGIDVALKGDALVAESPVWDDRQEVLQWVDVRGCSVHRFNPADGTDTTHETTKFACCLALRESGGLLVALRDELVTLDEQGSMTSLLVANFHRDQIRFNDGACDPAGRMWIGTLVEDERGPEASLYRLSRRATLKVALPHVTISNGIDWSPTGSTMYFVDSATRRIDAFSFDVDTGSLAARRVFTRIDDSVGRPDGLTVDGEGCVWVALDGGGEVRRYRPNGQIDQLLRFPVTRVTSCCFGGRDLSDLYVTSARWRLAESELEKQPLAGSIFACRPGASGMPPHRYAA